MSGADIIETNSTGEAVEAAVCEQKLPDPTAACDRNSGDGGEPVAQDAPSSEVLSQPLASDEAPEEGDEVSQSDSDSGEFQLKPQPNLHKTELTMPAFFTQLEPQWVGWFNQRMAVPYQDYPGNSPLGQINWDDYALIEDEENMRKGHHAVCPQIRCRKSGTVYRCKIVSCSRIHFNLTTLGFKECEYDKEVRSYLLERQLLFSFDHPFVRGGLGYFTDANFNFGVFMEDFPHGTLMDYYEKLESGKIVSKFKEDEVRLIAAQLVLALEYLHCVGCVHRDIQASNVLVDARGYVKLTDFAITAVVQPGERMSSVTCFRYYAAPEYFNEKGYGCPVDFYALGLMLYELLTQECFTDQEDIFDCDGSVDWGILPEELVALLRNRHQAKLEACRTVQAAEGEEDASDAQPEQLPFDHAVPSEPARSFVDDCLIYEPEFRPDRKTARFYDWFDGVDFESLYNKTLELPWVSDRVVSYQARPDEEYPLTLVLEDRVIPATLQPFTHLL